MKRRKFTPYIRRHHSGDRSESLRVAFRIAWFADRGKPFYVLVQHGVPGLVMAAATDRSELRNSLVGPRLIAARRGGNWKRPTTRDFHSWAANVGRRARGGEP